jgi:hypothetical protein
VVKQEGRHLHAYGSNAACPSPPKHKAVAKQEQDAKRAKQEQDAKRHFQEKSAAYLFLFNEVMLAAEASHSPPLTMLNVRTVQFKTVLSKPPVIIFKMRASICPLKSMPRANPHLETSTTDTSFT